MHFFLYFMSVPSWFTRMPPVIEFTRRFGTWCCCGLVSLRPERWPAGALVAADGCPGAGCTFGAAGASVVAARGTSADSEEKVGAGAGPSAGAAGRVANCAAVNRCLTLEARTLFSVPSFQTVSWG